MRLDTVFSSSSFDDQWTLLSAPFSSFINLGTGGNGVIDGNIDELVVVISGVQGAVGSIVEVDFDYFAFTSGGPIRVSEPSTLALLGLGLLGMAARRRRKS